MSSASSGEITPALVLAIMSQTGTSEIRITTRTLVEVEGTLETSVDPLTGDFVLRAVTP